MQKPYLSKSRLISAWQCPKRLHLETHHPEYGEVSAQTESLFATGHQVGAVAQQLYGGDDAVVIEFDFKRMEAQTRRLIDGGARCPIFEGTFRYENVLVRVDVMLPDGDGWRVIEVKASTSVKDHHVIDCAIQDWVLRNSGVNVTSISLAHIDNRFVYAGNGNYDGLLLENDLTDEVRTLEPTVVDLLVKARDAVAGQIPDIAVGKQCNTPYECQFINHCWPTDTDYPVMGLGGNKAKLAEFVALGARDILDVDEARITAGTQRRIHRVTCEGQPEELDGARRELESLPYPRHYLDFETIGPAVPIWAGTRPYASIPIQWSCHIEDESGALRHAEFLDTSGRPPMRELSEALIECLGREGPVLMYTHYERQVIEGLIDLFPDLAEPLQAIVDRLYDLHPVVKENYYHPNMLGSWSIKSVLPCIAPHMRYEDLEGITEGTAASEGFLEAIDPATAPERKAELEEQLQRYCRFDTEAMVEIVKFFTR
ncbi:MAG: DUF2779 domain-containing protein [Woeseiaceae bacterium]|nr:DUF2779 domain-containing protein [Woeseiaceae bacterium]NIP22136.1 DUF2779 domain-containing protein [Woeseiaceae bacterium]NIS91302.1 DUF2779 domain-containing protein [Woeseiaceae bacterium]